MGAPDLPGSGRSGNAQSSPVGFVSGHDVSRAVKRPEKKRALAPEYQPLAPPQQPALTYPYTGKEDDPANEKF